MKKRIFKSMKLSYVFALVIGALFMIRNVEARDIEKDLTLSQDITENLVVKSGKNVTIDLNGFNITTTNKDAIKVELGATLTLKGKGKIEAVGKGVAGLYNNGTTVIDDKNTEIYKKETKANVDTYYAILNHGKLTINNAKVTMDTILGKNASSLIASGYYNFTTNTAEKIGYVSGVGMEKPTLTINNGEFSGGINTVKNDDNGTLTINNGTFKNYIQVAVMNANITKINGGEFNVPTGEDKTTIYNLYLAGGYNEGILEVTGGTFKAENFIEGYANTQKPITITNGNFEIKYMINSNFKKDSLNNNTLKVSGGTFDVNSDVFSYLKEGFDAFDIENQKVIVDKQAEFKLNKKEYYIEKGKTIKLDYTANETGKKYTNFGSADENIATIKNYEITGVNVGKTTIDCFIGGLGEEVQVIVYEIKTDDATKKESNNLNNIINNIVENKTNKVIDEETSNKLLDAVKNGKTIETELTAKEVKASEISNDTKTKINKILKKEEKIAAFFDINVLLKADNNSIGKITELENTVLVSVDIPTTLPELKTGYTRKYYIIRVHNGETTKLDAKLVNGKIEFETDKFSDYALAYVDETTTAKEENKGKLDDVPKTGFINYTIMFIIFGLMALISFKILRKN